MAAAAARSETAASITRRTARETTETGYCPPCGGAESTRGPTFFCLVALAFDGFEPLLELAMFAVELVVFGLEFFGFLPPGIPAGGEVANLDFQGFVLSAPTLALLFPVVAALEDLGQKDAHGGAELVHDFRHRRGAVHGKCSKRYRDKPE
jgi:hypothetical protein